MTAAACAVWELVLTLGVGGSGGSLDAWERLSPEAETDRSAVASSRAPCEGLCQAWMRQAREWLNLGAETDRGALMSSERHARVASRCQALASAG